MATSDYLETAKTRDDGILIDNRERLNFLEQHIPGAISLPYRTLATPDKILRPKEDMRRLLENRGITGNSEIITYCGSVGTLSGLAYYALKSVGLPNAKLYVRSFKEWKSLQKPTEKQEDANYWDLSAE
jgi:thiosulfate/3-mercaptopyruvate sulfurtransferase